MRAQLRCQESMAKHCVSAAPSEASATTAVAAASMAAASMAAAVPARKQSSAAAWWSRATADTGWWRLGRKKKARSRSLTANRHPGKSSEHRRYKCGYIADSASSSGLDSWNSVSDAITWKHRESRGAESLYEKVKIAQVIDARCPLCGSNQVTGTQSSKCPSAAAAEFCAGGVGYAATRTQHFNRFGRPRPGDLCAAE